MKKKKTSKPKKTARKPVSKKKKPLKTAKRKAVKKKTVKANLKKVKKTSFGELAGTVTHYFPHVEAAVVKVKASKLRVGDQLRFKGHTTDFKEAVKSIQLDRVPIQEGKKGQEIGLLVKSRVRGGDSVYKI